MERTRRTVLVSLFALGAGCLGPGSPGGRRTEATTTTTTASDTRATTADGTTTSRNTDGTTTTTPTATDAGEVTVSDVTVAPGYAARNSPDSISVYGGRDEQFVVATVAGGVGITGALAHGEFSLAAAGEEFAPAEDVGGMGGRLWGRGERYGEAAEGWLAFEVPKPLDADAAAITWPGGEHALGDDALARLRRPPTTFEVREFGAPDAIQSGEDAVLTLTVENVGDARGVFVGALNRSGPAVAHTPETAFTLPVSAGETATWEYANTPDDRYGEGGEEGSMTFRLHWRDGSLSRTVGIRSGDSA